MTCSGAALGLLPRRSSLACLAAEPVSFWRRPAEKLRGSPAWNSAGRRLSRFTAAGRRWCRLLFSKVRTSPAFWRFLADGR